MKFKFFTNLKKRRLFFVGLFAAAFCLVLLTGVPYSKIEISRHIKNLASKNSGIRLKSFESLLEIGSPATPALFDTIKDKSQPSQVRIDAIQIAAELVKDKKNNLIETLLTVLDDEQWRVRYFAVHYFNYKGWFMEDKRIIKALSSMWAEEEVLSIKKEIAVTLAKTGNKDLSEVFLKTYKTDNPEVKLFSAIALYRLLGEEEYYKIIENASYSENPTIRIRTIWTLGEIWASTFWEDAKVASLLNTALKDKDPTIKELASKYLNRINTVQDFN